MCGICGIVDRAGGKVAEADIVKMMTRLRHRGPDDDGLFVRRNVGLGHVRLSIIDLSKAGHQPMFDTSGRFCILHNGEVYNYLELRRQLEGRYHFISNTDTEVILYSYINWGPQCLSKFNGMFAFVIYDRAEDELFMARDRFGIKPMYYVIDNERFIFASEIGAILEVAPEQKIIHDGAVFDYLVFNRTDQSVDTFYENVKRQEHGSYVILGKDGIVSRVWYDLPARIKDENANKDTFRDTFVDAVRLRLRSDVPVGVCLSGGIDSSSITCVLNRVLGKKDLQTFSAVYGGGEGDESEYIDLLRGYVLTMHDVTPTAETLLRDIDDFVTCHGEPVPSTGPYAQFKVMELARGNVKALLDGQGGDEVLAGYHYFFGTYLRELLLRMDVTGMVKELLAYYGKHRSLYALRSMIYYMLPNALKSRARLVGRDYLSRDFYDAHRHDTTLPGTLFDARSVREALLHHFAYKLEHLLKWEDRNSMWFSLEARVPFLDYRLVEATLALASREIMHDGETKRILRESMRGILPEAIRTRQDKVGFLTPEREWFRTPLFQEFILDMLNSNSFRHRPYFDHKKCALLYDAHLRKQINISRDIWKWMNIELWAKA